MSKKLFHWILSTLLLIPLLFFLPTLFDFNRDLRDVTGLILVLFGVAITVVVPLVGVWLEQAWLPYYVYILAPLEFLAVVGVDWFISLFGDQSYSFLSLGLASWPLLLYFGAEIVLAVMLQRRQKLGSQKR
jgi:hypothetical protein